MADKKVVSLDGLTRYDTKLKAYIEENYPSMDMFMHLPEIFVKKEDLVECLENDVVLKEDVTLADDTDIPDSLFEIPRPL